MCFRRIHPCRPRTAFPRHLVAPVRRGRRAAGHNPARPAPLSAGCASSGHACRRGRWKSATIELSDSHRERAGLHRRAFPYFGAPESARAGDFGGISCASDLSALPGWRYINSGAVRLYVNASANALDIEMGRVDNVERGHHLVEHQAGSSDIQAGLIQMRRPLATSTHQAAAPGMAWPGPTFGIALPGVTPATGGVRRHRATRAIAPRLVVNYTIQVDDGAFRFWQDAPGNAKPPRRHQLSAHAGVPGRFLRGRDGCRTACRHCSTANQRMEGWLGDFLARRTWPDIDGPDG